MIVERANDAMVVHVKVVQGMQLLIAIAALPLSTVAAPKSPVAVAAPSMVFFLTDDQDYIIGGFDRMEKTKRLIGDRGATFSNALVHSPICAISRSELQSGRYLYNIKSNDLPTPVRQHSGAGNGGQHHVNYTGLVAQHNFGRYLHERAGYTCGMFGKWMNEYNVAVAPGWDRWFAGMGYGNLTYADSDSPTGTYVACPFALGSCAAAPHMGYTTSLIGNKSLEWIRKVAPSHATTPFFAYVAVTAPHLPDVPPPWYACGNASCPSVWPTSHPREHAPDWYADCAAVRSPRLPNFDMDGAGFHEQIATQLPFDDEAIRYVDELAVMRCLTLLAVDDTVAELAEALDDLGVAEQTYFIYSSDRARGTRLTASPPHRLRPRLLFCACVHLRGKPPLTVTLAVVAARGWACRWLQSRPSPAAGQQVQLILA
jgi:N-acetylglucosamine-6-sulfatase